MSGKQKIEINDMVLVVKNINGGHAVGTVGIVIEMTSYDYKVMDGTGFPKFHSAQELTIIKKGDKV